MAGGRQHPTVTHDVRRASESSLLLAAQGGALAAYGELIRRHQSEVRLFLRRNCRDAMNADDYAQEAFIRAWDNLKQVRQPDSLRSWLFTIALRVARDQEKSRRRSSRREMVWLEDFSGTVEDKDGQLADLDLERALRRLPTAERLVASLLFGAGFSQSEVSAMTDIPLGSIKTYHRRARELLAEQLAPWHSNEAEREC